jgi:PAS domain S-box-containing protein
MAKRPARAPPADSAALFERNPLPLWVFDRETLRFLAVNDAAVRLYGWSRDEFLTLTVLDIRPPEDRPPLRDLLSTLGPAPYPPSIWRHWRRDGTIFDAEVHTEPLDYGGRPARLVLVLDVTARLRAEAALLEQRRFLRQVIDLNPNLIFVKDADGRFTLANQALADLYGASVDELIGKRDEDFNPNSAEVERFRRDDREVMATGRPRFIPEEPNTDALTGATRWFQVIKVPLPDAAGRVTQVLGVATDITQRRALEGQLRQAQKLEAVGRLAGGIAHDFNNLLTAIQGFSALLLQDGSLSGQQHRDVREIADAAARAAALTQQLLAFGRKQVLSPTVLDPNDVVSHMGAMLRRLIAEHIELRTELGPDVGAIRADRGQLEQVIVNLVVNARDAMPRGGTLTIATRNATIGDASAAQTGLRPGRYVLLTVSDTGVGMDAATRARVFEPFFTTKRVGEGSGLGLATVYGIVEQSGGTIAVESEPGRGSTFRIHLPRVAAEVAAPEVAVPRADRGPSGTETVLVVEDEPTVRKLARQTLERAGYCVLEAADGPAALAAAATWDGPIHLVLTDVVMPGMSGPELAARLHATRPGLAVVYTSGYTESAVVHGGEVDATVAFIPKPYVPDQLTAKVREALDRAASS